MPYSGGGGNSSSNPAWHLGYFPTEADLVAAYPVGGPGMCSVIGTTDTLWIWDDDTTAWVNSGASSTAPVKIVSRPPDENDDGVGTGGAGFDAKVSMLWLNNAPVAINDAVLWICTDATTGAAVWRVVDATYREALGRYIVNSVAKFDAALAANAANVNERALHLGLKAGVTLPLVDHYDLYKETVLIGEDPATSVIDTQTGFSSKFNIYSERLELANLTFNKGNSNYNIFDFAQQSTTDAMHFTDVYASNCIFNAGDEDVFHSQWRTSQRFNFDNVTANMMDVQAGTTFIRQVGYDTNWRTSSKITAKALTVNLTGDSLFLHSEQGVCDVFLSMGCVIPTGAFLAGSTVAVINVFYDETCTVSETPATGAGTVVFTKVSAPPTKWPVNRGDMLNASDSRSLNYAHHGEKYDNFTTQDGVDLGASSGQLWSADGYYYPDPAAIGYGVDEMLSRTWTVTSRATVYGDPNDSLDGDLATGYSDGGNTFSWWLAAQTGTPTAFIPAKARIYQSTAALVDIEIRGSNDAVPDHNTGTWVTLADVTLADVDAQWQDVILDSSGVAYLHYNVVITGGAYDPNYNLGFEEIEIWGFGAEVMALQSTASTAPSAPTDARIDLYVDNIEPFDPTTDVTAKVSTNGGGIWHDAPLTYFGDTGDVYQCTFKTVTPDAGTSIVWRVALTANIDAHFEAAGVTYGIASAIDPEEMRLYAGVIDSSVLTHTVSDTAPEFTLESSTGLIDYAVGGVRYSVDGPLTYTFPGAIAEGEWVFYLHPDGTIHATQDLTNPEAFIRDGAIVGYTLWNATDSTWDWNNWELHSASYNPIAHLKEHTTIGALYVPNGGFQPYQFDIHDGDNNNAPTTDRQNQFLVSGGKFFDEDNPHVLPENGTGLGGSVATAPRVYREGYTWRKLSSSPYGTHQLVAGNRLAYNEVDDLGFGSWVEMANDRDYINAFMLGTADHDQPYMWIIGQGQHLTRDAARDAIKSEWNKLFAIGLPIAECIPLFAVTYQSKNDSSWDAFGNRKLVYVDDDQSEFLDLRGVSSLGVGIGGVPGSSPSVIMDHSAATNLDVADQHPIDVTIGLQDALDAKLSLSGGTMTGNLSMTADLLMNGSKLDGLATPTTDYEAVPKIYADAKEAALGNPTVDGQALVSTIAGSRSWATISVPSILAADWVSVVAININFAKDRYALHCTNSAEVQTCTLPEVSTISVGWTIWIINDNPYGAKVVPYESGTRVGRSGLGHGYSMPGLDAIARFTYVGQNGGVDTWEVFSEDGAVMVDGLKCFLECKELTMLQPSNTGAIAPDSAGRHNILSVGDMIVDFLATSNTQDTYAYKFDGSGDYLQSTTSQDFNMFASLTGDYTIRIRARWDTAVEGYAFSMAGSNTYLQLYRDAVGVLHTLLRINGATYHNNESLGVTIAAGTYADCVFVKIGDVCAWYIDGDQVTYEVVAQTSAVAATAHIGHREDGASPMDGAISEFFLVAQNLYGAVPAVALDDTITIPDAPASLVME